MLFILSSRWWIPLTKGIVAMLVGLLVISWTRTTISSLVQLFGVYCLIDGVLSFVIARDTATRKNQMRQELRAAGAFSVGAGCIALIWSNMSIELLAAVASQWAICRGVCEAVMWRRVRRVVLREHMLLLIGIWSLALNFMLLISFFFEPFIVRWIIGAFIAVRGSLFFVVGSELYKCKRAYYSPPQASVDFS